MLISRRIGEHRPTAILIVLVLVSLASLATGTRTSPIRNALRAAVSATSYPFVRVLRGAEDGLDYGLNFVFSYHQAWEEARVSRRYLADVMQRAARKDELQMEMGEFPT